MVSDKLRSLRRAFFGKPATPLSPPPSLLDPSSHQHDHNSKRHFLHRYQQARPFGTSSSSHMPSKQSSIDVRHVLTRETINPHLLETKYAVRGELAIRAEQLRQQLEQCPPTAQPLPFGHIVNCNIGNPQQLGQTPITYFRQVLALIECPEMLQDAKTVKKLAKIYPEDVIDRAKSISQAIGAVGAYSHSKGVPAIREAIARFIQKRDGFPADPENIFLSNGASESISHVLKLVAAGPNVGVMVPIPQYPLYTATLSLLNVHAVPYYLDEATCWSLSREELNRAIGEARESGIDVRALCVINPGNPTGNCLSARVLEDIVRFCHEERVVLLSDEVYQENTYDPAHPFISAKKTVKSMGPDYDNFELISFHSVSKGLIGECGRRGGYMECLGLDPEVVDEIYKMASISLCPNLVGQIMTWLMVEPPQAGTPSFAKYSAETSTILASLKRRAEMLRAAFNSMQGMSCQPAQGAMYLFPSIKFPQQAIDAAAAVGKTADEFYSIELLNATGVCVVPGSGFGQVNETFHIRSTFLPPESEFAGFIDRISKFHAAFMKKYGRADGNVFITAKPN